MSYARIAGTGGYLPEKVLYNADLELIVDTTDAWILERTGIKKRHIASEGETTCDLAEMAARRALEAARREPSEIDLIVLATSTPDRVLPSTACLLQQRLKIHGGAAFDIQAACTGFVYAIDVAEKFVRTGAARCALVVGAETMSRIVDWTDRSTCVLFGDGAGAVVLEAAEQPGIFGTSLHADGQYEHLLRVQAGISRGYEQLRRANAYIEMHGNEVFKAAVGTMSKNVEETLAAQGMTVADIDWLIPHQANIRILAAAAKRLQVGMERMVATIAEHGNTSAASVPLALDTAVRDGRIQRGHTVLLEAFGSGFTWGSTLLKY